MVFQPDVAKRMRRPALNKRSTYTLQANLFDWTFDFVEASWEIEAPSSDVGESVL